MVTPPTGPKPPTGPGTPARPQPEKTTSGKVKPPAVTRPDLHPKVKAGLTLGGIVGAVVVLAGVIPGIADKLNLTIPGIVATVITLIATLGAAYAKAGDGR